MTSFVILLLVVFAGLYLFRPKVAPQQDFVAQQESTPTPTLTPSPTPYVFTTYVPPKINKKDVYKIAMIGDSMTAALGPHGGQMSENLNLLYEKEDKSQAIIVDNYAVSSNILASNNQITQEANISEYNFGPILSVDYEIGRAHV